MNSNLGYGFYPTHPGEILKDEFEARGLSQRHFSQVTGVSYTTLNEVLNAKRPVSTDLALTLEAAMGVNAEMLVGLQTRYDMQLARQDKAKTKRWDELRRTCAAAL